MGGSTTVDLLHRWAPSQLDTVDKFGAPTVTIALTWVLSVRGRKGFGWERIFFGNRNGGFFFFRGTELGLDPLTMVAVVGDLRHNVSTDIVGLLWVVFC